MFQNLTGKVIVGWKAIGKILKLLCLISAMIVREVSVGLQALLSTKKYTLAKNPLSAKHVEKASPDLHTLFNIREDTQGRNLSQ